MGGRAGVGPGFDSKTTSPMTCNSLVSITSQLANPASRQSLPRMSWINAMLRASSSLSAGTIAICRLAWERSSHVTGVRRYSVRVSRTVKGSVGFLSMSFGSSAIGHPIATTQLWELSRAGNLRRRSDSVDMFLQCLFSNNRIQWRFPGSGRLPRINLQPDGSPVDIA
jgi:hypothetical protein